MPPHVAKLKKVVKRDSIVQKPVARIRNRIVSRAQRVFHILPLGQMI